MGKESRRHNFYPWVTEIPLEKGMATHSSLLAWRIPWTEEPGGLQSMGSQELNTSEGTEHAPSINNKGAITAGKT